MSSDEKVFDFPKAEITSEEKVRRAMAEAKRLASLAPGEWRLWIDRAAERLGVPRATLEGLISAIIKDSERKAREDKAEARRQAVLKQWEARQASTRDVIVKLHTGQGKTLVGLLMLQSRLNAGNGPVVYLCPDHFLIAQTCEQARQFGIRTCTADDDLPEEFLNSHSILVTSVQKLFNGMTKFGLNRASIEVDTVLMDDAHACADRIREACRIRIPKDEPAYESLKTLFATELEQQGAGTYADIENGKRDALLPVPYWAWMERESEVASILSSQADRKSVKFAWPLLRDMLTHCQCVVSGTTIEIEPYLPPLSAFDLLARGAPGVHVGDRYG